MIPDSLPSRRGGRLLAAPLLVVVGGLLLAGCGDDSPAPATPAPAPAPVPAPAPTPPPPGPPETAIYTFTLPEVRISPRVPGTLPEGVDYASAIALVAHPRDAAPFAPDRPASDGLKTLAEQGTSDALIAEVPSESAEVIAGSLAELLRIFLSPDPSIEINLERPCLTYAQRIAPSPDWFIGFANVCATDEEGNWRGEISADLVAYDAGTAEGDSFEDKAEGADTDPRDPVTLLEAPPWFEAPAIVQVLGASLKTE